jgi:hypothetical protein
MAAATQPMRGSHARRRRGLARSGAGRRVAGATVFARTRARSAARTRPEGVSIGRAWGTRLTTGRHDLAQHEPFGALRLGAQDRRQLVRLAQPGLVGSAPQQIDGPVTRHTHQPGGDTAPRGIVLRHFGPAAKKGVPQDFLGQRASPTMRRASVNTKPA